MNITLGKKIPSIRLQHDLYLYLKNKAVKSNQSVNSYIQSLLIEGSGFSEPNDQTISAINEIKNKKHELDIVKGVDELNSYLLKLRASG